MILNNEQFEMEKLRKNDVFIAAIGYESRSYFLYEKIKSKIDERNILLLMFSNNEKYATKKKMDEIVKRDHSFLNCEYYDYKIVVERAKEFLASKKRREEEICVHIDYSSMPRSWYTRLFLHVKNILKDYDKICFWYVEGAYPQKCNQYPSAGCSEIATFIGKPSIRAEQRRTHIVGLSYDGIRTQALLSLIDPEVLVVCNAFSILKPQIRNNVEKINKGIIDQAGLVVSLATNDFKYMLSKLCELAYEYQPIGDVIIVPDGPKPLVMAMSLVPEIISLEGVSVLHIARNDKHYTRINVKPTGSILGFSISI